MINTVENRIGKSVYGILQFSVLVLTFFTFQPNSPDMRDDIMTVAMICLMGLLSFPVSIIAAPLAFGLSFAIVGAFFFTLRQFTDVENISPFPEIAFIFLSWLGIFISGYWQWFGLVKWSREPLTAIDINK
jgi:hypothetical protein